MASTKISYLDKEVYIGIDVHVETYSVTCFCDDLIEGYVSTHFQLLPMNFSCL